MDPKEEEAPQNRFGEAFPGPVAMQGSDGVVYQLNITAEAEVTHPDGSKE